MMLQEKAWDKNFEKPIYEEWKRNKVFRFIDTDKPIFSIDTPPPYVNTPIHIGHAATYSIMDMFARFKRMIGFNVLFPLGLDRNGLPIEMAAEKRFGVTLRDVEREKFIEMCKIVLEESSTESIDSFLRLGISFNSWEIGNNIGDMYLTDSSDYRALTQATFIDLWKKGLIYEADRVNNYCPGCMTTLADAEIIYKDIPSTFVDIKFKVKESGEDIIIGTTRPELICTCTMIIFNPDDERYKHLEGKTAITPLFNKEVPIRSHPIAKIEKGTGLMMVCSFGDQDDIRFFREMNLKPIIAINIDGTMNENAGFLQGLRVEKAREKIIQELEKNNLVVNKKRIIHRTPICERSKHPIEFISMPEFYLKQTEFLDEIRKVAMEIEFYSPKSREILLNWIDSVSIDWPISRRRYYGTEIPLWYCKKCGETILPEKGHYVKPWQEPPPIKNCPKCGGNEFRGEERVFDTWFDSSNTPLYIMKFGSEFFEKHAPCTLRPQGKEIIRTWLYYTLLKCYILTKKPAFRDVWINYHIVDDHGHKMSKSLGNIIDPHDILERFGAEPFRLWCVLEGNLEKKDFRCSFERIEGASKTITKLWNVARFISQFEQTDDYVLLDLDKWIIHETNKLIKYSRKKFEKYDFHNPAVRIKHFLWETFASHYLELVKNRAYNQENKFTKEEQGGAIFTLHYCLDSILKLLAPIIPFITYKIYKELRNKDIHLTKFPEPIDIKFEPPFTTDELIEINSIIWKSKKDKNLSLKSEIKKVTIPHKFECIEKDFLVTHNIKTINYSEVIEILL
ncbi:MAG: valine--tRNA ligase [Candidatus Aenigmatarchaeota archaeon]